MYQADFRFGPLHFFDIVNIRVGVTVVSATLHVAMSLSDGRPQLIY